MRYRNRKLSELDVEPHPKSTWIMRVAGLITSLLTLPALIWPTTAFEPAWLLALGVSAIVFLVARAKARPDADSIDAGPWHFD